MGRDRYLIREPSKPHFMTCTVLNWLPVFTRPETVTILLDCWAYQREHAGLQLYGYVVLENHIHFIARSASLDKDARSFKSYTARRILQYLESRNAFGMLSCFQSAKKAHQSDRKHQFWEEGVHAEQILSHGMMRQKLEYIHANPVTRGYVDKAEHWRYSSARNYAGQQGVVDIDCWWG